MLKVPGTWEHNQPPTIPSVHYSMGRSECFPLPSSENSQEQLFRLDNPVLLDIGDQVSSPADIIYWYLDQRSGCNRSAIPVLSQDLT